MVDKKPSTAKSATGKPAKGAKREAAAAQYREVFGKEPKKSQSAAGMMRDIEKRAVADRRTAQRSTQISGIFGGPGPDDLPKDLRSTPLRPADLAQARIDTAKAQVEVARSIRASNPGSRNAGKDWGAAAQHNINEANRIIDGTLGPANPKEIATANFKKRYGHPPPSHLKADAIQRWAEGPFHRGPGEPDHLFEQRNKIKNFKTTPAPKMPWISEAPDPSPTKPIVSGQPNASLGQRVLSTYGKVATPLAAYMTVSQGVNAYAKAKSEGKSTTDAALEGMKAAAPGALALSAPAWTRGAGAAGTTLLEIAGIGADLSMSVPGALINISTGGVPYMATGAAAIGGVALKAVEAAGKIAGRAALPLAVGMAAYDGYQGYKKGGIKGAALGVADSLTFGATSWAADKISGAMSTANAKLSSSEASQYKRALADFNARPTAPAKASTTGGPRGWANPTVQKAAQEARAKKYGYTPKT